MEVKTYKELSGKQKAAILVAALGPEKASDIYKHLNQEEIEDLTLEIAGLGKVSKEVRDRVVEEFHQLCLAQEYITRGGMEYAREILEKALGRQKANEIMSRLAQTLQVTPFEFMRRADASQIFSFLQGEHPQTISLIIAHLQPEQGAMILSSLPTELQADVAKRIAEMDRTSPEVIRDVERVLERKLASIMGQDFAAAGGVKSLVEVLNRVDRGTEKGILETLEEQDPELAEEVKRLMFVFEDIIGLDARSVQQILREVDMKDLALALKGASEEVKQKIFSNMSERASTILKEDMDFMGPVRLRNVEDAQQRIVNVIRRLEEAGEIVVARGGQEEIVV